MYFAGTTSTIFALVSLSTMAMGGEETTAEWLETHAVPKTTETREFSSSGDLQSVTLVREYAIQIKQRYVETLKRDENGSLTAASRTRQTDTVDAHGGNKVVKEANVGAAELAVTEEVDTFKSGNVTEITTRKRDSNGQLVTSERVTQTRQEDGTTVTVTESRGDGGRLIVKRVTTQN